ncbi:MAG: NTP transferase domain-containing protein [Spirochaetes bacterium]|nr:NTP transferase domain-containing protein [Spirochaetota bacterium]
MQRKPDCVMLAAGESRRMGKWKLLVRLRGKTLIECSVDGALGACGRVILVTGHRARTLEAIFGGRPDVFLVHNPDYKKGMFSSVLAGAAHVETDRFFLALGDMPLVGERLYTELLRYKDVPAVIPKYRGKKGHPLLLERSVKDTILALGPERTMRDVLAQTATLAVPVENRYVLVDIDEPEDLKKITEETG